MMQDSDPRDVFFSLPLTLMIYTYNPSLWTEFSITLIIDSHSKTRSKSGIPRQARLYSSGRIFLSIPHTHDEFLYSVDVHFRSLDIGGRRLSVIVKHSELLHYLSRNVRQRTFEHMCQTKIQITLRIHEVRPESSMCVFWIGEVQCFFMQTRKTLIRPLGFTG